jgi:hypothetical protein
MASQPKAAWRTLVLTRAGGEGSDQRAQVKAGSDLLRARDYAEQLFEGGGGFQPTNLPTRAKAGNHWPLESRDRWKLGRLWAVGL